MEQTPRGLLVSFSQSAGIRLDSAAFHCSRFDLFQDYVPQCSVTLPYRIENRDTNAISFFGSTKGFGQPENAVRFDRAKVFTGQNFAIGRFDGGFGTAFNKYPENAPKFNLRPLARGR